MTAPPLTTLETLRSLDRRLLGVEGDLENLVADELEPHWVERHTDGPDRTELTRLEIELAAVARELVAAAAGQGIEVPAVDDPSPSRDDGLTAWTTLREYTVALRRQLHAAVDALVARHPELRRQPALAPNDLAIEGPWIAQQRRSQFVVIGWVLFALAGIAMFVVAMLP